MLNMDRNYISQLRQILERGSLTQAELAKRLGVTFAALNRWIHGHAKPHAQRIRAIERLYKEVVGYPSLTPEELKQLVDKAKALKKRRLWNFIASHQPLQDELLLEHTYNSNAIEGSTLTKRETEAVVFHKTVVPDHSLVEHLEVTNHAAVLRKIFDKKYQGPVSEAFIKELHKDLLQGIRDDHGEYSKHQRAIRGVPIALTHPEDVPEEMGHLIRSWRSRPSKKTVKEIAKFHVDFELIHPFGDGNGRVGRLVMTFQCLQFDDLPVIIENARKAEYYDVLEYAQRKSIGPFIAFLVDEMERTRTILQKYL